MISRITARAEFLLGCLQKVAKKKSFLLPAFLLLLYFLIGVILFPRFKYVINADAISYIFVAKKYLAGHFREAINAYWGPLISWLLLPFMLLISEPLEAARLLNLILSGLLFIGFWVLSLRFKISSPWRPLLALAYFPLGYYFAYAPFTPDLLVVVILVFYFCFLFDPEYHLSAIKAFGCGLLGSLAYLAKSYNFFFFLFHFPVFHVLSAWRKKNHCSHRLAVRQVIIGLVTFLAISSLWSVALKHKYGYFTLGTTASHAWTYIAPDSRGETLTWIGLFPPPDRFGISAWEDPSFFPVNIWSPFSCRSNLIYFLNHLYRNGKSFFALIFNQSPFYLLILVSFISLLAWNYSKNRHLDSLSLDLLFAFFVYPAGFLLFYFQERYIWISFVLLYLMTGILFTSVSYRGRWAKVLLISCFLIAILSYAIVPGRYLAKDYNRLSSGFSGRKLYQVAEALKKARIRGNIASNDYWSETLCLAYYTGSRYFGKIRENMIASELQEELKKNRIRYFFLWGKGQNEPKLVSISQEVIRFEDIRLRIFRLIQ